MTVEPAEEPINADPTYAPLIEAERQAADDAAHDDKGRGVLRFYELAKKQEWQVRDMPWGEIPPIPETRAGASPERKERRQAVWRSVITQQLQADEFAVEMAAQLLNLAPHREAKLYYSTMVQDEARHVEAWLKLANEAGGVAERDPHLDELAKMTLEAETLEEKVFQMQVFFERLIIPRFRLIARSSRGTLLEDLCNRLTIDDGIHHSSGVAYERVLLEGASKQTKDRLVNAANQLLPIFVEHALWRPEGARLDRERDARDRHSAAAGRRPRRDPDGLEHGPRRLRHPAALRGIDRIPPHHDPSCFGCGDHELGLRMALPAEEGADTYASEVTFGVHHQGGPGIAHGGIVGAALDEACGLLATWHRFPTVTARIAIRYRKPAPINRPLQVAARVSSERGRRIEISAELRDGDELLAEADGAFLHVPLEHFLATPEGRAAGEAWAKRLSPGV